MKRLGPMWLGLFALLAVVAALGAPSASGAGPSWSFETETYYFGPQLAGGSSTEHQFVLTDTGDTKIERILWGIRWWWPGTGPLSIDSELFRLVTDPPCRTLEPGASCSMSVAFTPQTVGPKEGRLEVWTSGGEPTEAGVELRGEGASPQVAFEPEHLDFGSVEVGQSAAQTITVENQGDLGLAIENILVAELLFHSSGGFQVAGGSCQAGQVVPPGGSCTIQVAFTPSGAGTLRSVLSISDDAPPTPQSIELLATGVWPPPSSSGGGTTPTSSTATRPKNGPPVCPKGKRRAVKKGKKICVKSHRHRYEHRRRRKVVRRSLARSGAGVAKLT
jgi:Abnormal spindle-like microcephaly-assoc'd, ASPM-SPD-2-Hydin